MWVRWSYFNRIMDGNKVKRDKKKNPLIIIRADAPTSNMIKGSVSLTDKMAPDVRIELTTP